MCGIFGYFSLSGKNIDSETVNLMGKTIEYRGPDGMGCYQEHGRALGNQRLAIIDVELGQQPFYSDDKSIVVVQNGEIFNHVELAQNLSGTPFQCKTNCDTEVILRLYQQHGIDFVSMLNGMFAIAIYDKNTDKMYLIRDRVGEKPLYFHKSTDSVLFASEIKSILNAGAKKDLDYQALDSYLSYNYVVPPATMFKGVRHVMPGTYLEISNVGVQEFVWWDVSSTKPLAHSEEHWINEIKTILDDSTKIRLRADVPFGAFLSGGIDSSSVVGYMSRNLDRPVKTFSIGFHDDKYDESKYAEYAAKRFETDHICQKVEANLLNLWSKVTYHTDQPHGDVSFMPTYKVAELASEKVKMVLTGDGADELFAGYDKYKEFLSEESEQLTDADFQLRYLESISLFKKSKKVKLYSECTQNKIGTFDAHEQALQLFNKVSHQDRINQVLYVDTKLLLPGNNLVKPDRMGMAVSIENRAPFLDYRMLELAFEIPGELKLRDGESKYILKKSVSDVIGKELTYRKKQMFTVPIGEWLKHDLKDMVEDLLFSDRALSRNLFNANYVKNIYRNHCKGVENNTREVRALMALEIWFREFID